MGVVGRLDVLPRRVPLVVGGVLQAEVWPPGAAPGRFWVLVAKGEAAMKCCYCKTPIRGKVKYSIPEGYPTNPAHDGKPLCNECGGKPDEPSLDDICERLDRELLDGFGRPRRRTKTKEPRR